MSYKASSTCLKSSFFVVCLLLLQTAPAQFDFRQLDQDLETRQKLLGKDFVLMLWKDTLIYKKEFGEFNSKTQAPIASASKWLTAALVMQFVDEGKLSLDDKVSRWLPEFERYNKNYITIRLCLSHQTGIADESNFLKKVFQHRAYKSLEEEVNAFAKREIRTNPGQDFWYGNIGLNIAARVLEVMTKKNFDVLIKQKLFNPLAMRRTSFTNAMGAAINPSGGAISTPDDYMKFLVMLKNNGKAGGKQILSEESIAELKKLQTGSVKIAYAPKAAEGYGYALGSWVAEEKDGNATVLTSPGLFGTWPMIDFCRGYAYLFFVKNLLGEQRADAHMEMKKIVDAQIPAACK